MSVTGKASSVVKDILKLVETSLDDDKAQDVTVIDLEGRSTLSDFMVIATGTSHRQVGAMADHILRQLKNKGLGSVPVEGLQTCDWVLIDAGDVVVHLFRPEVRDFYKIEKIWKTGPGDKLRASGGIA